MVMDVLSRLIEREVWSKNMDTYQVNGATFITYLMYEDDVLILTKANPKSLKVVKSLLDVSIHFLRLSVNITKSSFTFAKV